MHAPKILIAYESRHGQTARIAERLADDVGARGAETTTTRIDRFPRDRSLEAFDLVVVGSPVYFGRHRRGAVRFVKDRLGELSRRPSAFFSVSGHAIEGSPDGEVVSRGYVEAFLEETGWRPDLVARFGGAVRYTRYNVLLRFVMRRIERAAGRSTDTSRDHEYTRWDAVEDFARDLRARASHPEKAPAG